MHNSSGHRRVLSQLPQPPLEGVEAALDVAQLGEELERVLPADGVSGAGAEHGYGATELLDLEAPVHDEHGLSPTASPTTLAITQTVLEVGRLSSDSVGR